MSFSLSFFFLFFFLPPLVNQSTGEEFQAALKAFEREIKVLTTLHHPNIVRVLGSCRHADGALLLVAERAVNSLDAIIPRPGGLPPETTAKYALDIARGLEYLHSCAPAVVHCDVKPANILIAVDGSLQLADFNIAHVMAAAGVSIGPITAVGGLRGTVNYTAPENYNDEHQFYAQAPSDLYGLACVIYEMSTGNVPWADLKWLPIVQRVSRGERPGLPETMPADLSQLVRDCWAQNPADRPSASDVVARLEAMLMPPPPGQAGAVETVRIFAQVLGGLQPYANDGTFLALDVPQHLEMTAAHAADGFRAALRLPAGTALFVLLKQAEGRRVVPASSAPLAQLGLGPGSLVLVAGGAALSHFVTENETATSYRLAAERGDAEGQFALGCCYYFGRRGVDQDYVEAVVWYRRAAEQGNASAQNNLGFCFEHGKGVDQDYALAVLWYRRAAEQGHASAQNNLGFCFQHGRGVGQNYAEAVACYRRAAEQGQADAQNNLGFCFQYGHGVDQNYVEAVAWYRRAAEQGNAGAQCNLGICFERGHGVDQDHVEAMGWYRRAAKQGQTYARAALRRLATQPDSES